MKNKKYEEVYKDKIKNLDNIYIDVFNKSD